MTHLVRKSYHYMTPNRNATITGVSTGKYSFPKRRTPIPENHRQRRKLKEQNRLEVSLHALLNRPSRTHHDKSSSRIEPNLLNIRVLSRNDIAYESFGSVEASNAERDWRHQADMDEGRGREERCAEETPPYVSSCRRVSAAVTVPSRAPFTHHLFHFRILTIP